MTYEPRRFVADHYYHIFNRGVEQRLIFLDDRDREHFLLALNYYLDSSINQPLSQASKPAFRPLGEIKLPLVEVICYCLMPNHYHLLLVQRADLGITQYLRQVTNSYTRYFNTRYQRVGSLFQGTFKSVRVEDDNQLLQLSRYIHLNPYVAQLADSVPFRWSSYEEYTSPNQKIRLCNPQIIKSLCGSRPYQDFVTDYQDYARRLAAIKHLLQEELP